MELQFKENLFVSFYIGKASGNGTLAARLAGYQHPRRIATRLLAKVHIREAIADHVSTVAMEADEVLATLSDVARSNADDFLAFDPDKSPNAPPSLNLRKARRRGRLRSIKKLKAAAAGDSLPIVEVELRDPIPALALLAKYHGLLEKKATPPPEGSFAVDLSDDPGQAQPADEAAG